jgi:cell wall assembly regulator SMI1
VRDLWERLESWATTNSGRSLGWRAGASERRIAAAEQKLRIQLPVAYRATLRLHDGQAPDGAFPWLPGCAPLLSLDEVVARWDAEQDLVETVFEDELCAEGPLYTALWHPRRIPIAEGTYIDLVPSRAGVTGQIITFVPECGLVCVGDGLHDAVEHYTCALERGEWMWSQARGIVARGGGQAHPALELASQVARHRVVAPRPRRRQRQMPSGAA